MEIEMVKHPFEYRKFYHVLKFNNEIDNKDAEILGTKVCKQLKEKTKVQWRVSTCVGGKCTIESKMINKKEKRKKLKGQIITIDNVHFF